MHHITSYQIPSLFHSKHNNECTLVRGRRLTNLLTTPSLSSNTNVEHNTNKSVDQTHFYNSWNLFQNSAHALVPFKKFKQLHIIHFPSPYHDFQIERLIDMGKYGYIALVKPFIAKNKYKKTIFSNHLVSNIWYVVKVTTHVLSYQLEAKAYEFMSKSWLTETRQSNCHPFISRLLSKTVMSVGHSDFNTLSTGCLKQSNATASLTKCYLLLFDLAAGNNLNNLAFNYLNRNLKIDEAAFYIAEIAEALIWLHKIGIVHCDIKPDNVLIGHDGHVLLTDFGLAHIMPGGPGTRLLNNIISTSQHMPPEICTAPVGKTFIWHAVDWYSVGVLFYRLLTLGKYPPPRLSKQWITNTDVPMVCNCLLEGLLQPDPNNRLGGDFIVGGNWIFAHPGFICALLGLSIQSKKIDSSLITSTLDLNLKCAMLNTFEKFRDLSSNQNLSIDRINESIVNEDLPYWIPQLRMAIRNRSLTPPHRPIIIMDGTN